MPWVFLLKQEKCGFQRKKKTKKNQREMENKIATVMFKDSKLQPGNFQQITPIPPTTKGAAHTLSNNFHSSENEQRLSTNTNKS